MVPAGIEQVVKVTEGWRQDGPALEVVCLQVQSQCCNILRRIALHLCSAEVGKCTVTCPFGKMCAKLRCPVALLSYQQLNFKKIQI